MKKKHFDTQSNNLLTDLEYMRINAERERIKKYQDITKGSAYKYCKILNRIHEDNKEITKEQNEGQKRYDSSADPQIKMKKALKENKNKNLLVYITGKYFCYRFYLTL
jgi:hypothetical protein